MPKYSYEATNESGETITGETVAEKAAEALAKLEADGLQVESIQLVRESVAVPEKPALRSTHADSSSPYVKLDDQFQAAMDRRHALIPAFAALADEMPVGKAKVELRQLSRALQGAEFATDLRRSKVATRWLPLLVTGFSNESNSRHLSDLLAHASQESENRRQRRRSLAYPFLIFLLALGVLLGLCSIVVPTFESMFHEFGLMLPLPTRMVLGLSHQIRTNPGGLFLGVALSVAVVFGLLFLWTRFALTTRLFGFATSGNSLNVNAMSRLTRQLAELLSIEVSLPDALWIAGQQCQHHHFKLAAEQLARDAHRGKISDSSVAHNFPANMIHALTAGPKGGPNVPLLRELSTVYSDRVANRVDWSTGVIAQGALVFVGIMIGFTAIALLAPMVSLISSLS
ncbi:MAG: type II secretion system F family protein [Rubripirellula sp.]